MRHEQNQNDDQVLMEDGGNIGAFLYRLKKEYPKEYEIIARTIRVIPSYFDDFP